MILQVHTEVKWLATWWPKSGQVIKEKWTQRIPLIGIGQGSKCITGLPRQPEAGMFASHQLSATKRQKQANLFLVTSFWNHKILGVRRVIPKELLSQL